jgi:signal peptidase I
MNDNDRLNNITNDDDVNGSPSTAEEVLDAAVLNENINSCNPSETCYDSASDVPSYNDECQDEVMTPRTSKIEQLARERKVKSIIARIVSIVGWVVGVCLIVLCLSNIYQRTFNPNGYTGFFGIGEAVVSSDSMQPQLYTNDLIFYKAAHLSEIEKEDVIIYKRTDSRGNEILIVHQVIDIGNGYVTTKGLNNSVADDPVPVSAIVGEYMFKVPQAGILLNALQSRWAPIIVLLFLVAVTALRIGMYCLRKRSLINRISNDTNNRDALNHFFDI